MVIKCHNKTKWKTNFLLILHLVIQTEIFSAPVLGVCWEGIELACTGRNSTANRWRNIRKKCLQGICCLTCVSYSLCWMLQQLMKPQEPTAFTKLQGLHVKPDLLQMPSLLPTEQASAHWLQQQKKSCSSTLWKHNLHWDRITQSYHWMRPFRKRETRSS